MVRDHSNPCIAIVLFQDGYTVLCIVRAVKMATVTSR